MPTFLRRVPVGGREVVPSGPLVLEHPERPDPPDWVIEFGPVDDEGPDRG